jgi:hypothetical protein
VTSLAPYPAVLDWTAPGFPFGSIGWFIPFSTAYESFTRVFHSVTEDGADVSWHELASRQGVAWHPEIQFADLRYRDDHARLGSLDEPRLRSLVRDLDAAGAGTECVLGLWDGETWVTAVGHEDSDTVTVRQEDWEASGGLRRSGPAPRVYRLFSAALAEVPDVGWYARSDLAWPQPPTVFWDAQGSFCVASDPDYDSTIVASDPATQQRILADPDLEAAGIPVAGSLLLHR